ncbi:MAG: fumarate hydratase [Clostridiales bacterium]|nr:fumarate hydratase [Clostridiales bacterium]
MRIIESTQITNAIARLCIEANCRLPEDVLSRVHACAAAEPRLAAKDILEKILQNDALAAERGVPICQDTGMACVFAELGEDVHINGSLRAAVDEGVRRGYAAGYLRKSVVGDPLRRANTGDNTPALLHVELMPGDKLTLTVAPKGFGSENMSKLKMLRPSDGVEGVINFVLSVVEEAGSNPCPPVVVGVGLGGNFEQCALLAKKALLRPLDEPHPDPYYRDLEKKLLEKINALGIGPQGFGGRTTALSVAIETLPTHIAGLPCAVNLNCHVARHMTEVL